MYVLHIEHPVPDYASWKSAFDSDPIDRAASGVVRYRVYRPVDDERYIITDLEFSDVSQANIALEKLRTLWQRVDVVAGGAPQTRILEIVESGQPA